MTRLTHLLMLLVSLAASYHPSIACSVPKCQRETVTSLLRTMLRSVMPDDPNPNPSVLIALRLARDHNLPKERQLLQGLKAAAIRKVQNGEDFSSGLVALYSLALTASCSDPSTVTFSGSSVNLLEILVEKLNREIEHIENTTFPLSNYYQVSLDVLTLCLLKVELSHRTIKTLTDAVQKNKFTHGSEFSVDTGAVAALALRCLSDKDMLVKGVEEALNKVLSQILVNVKDDGTIGNLYSTGLAIQAISVNPHDVPVNAWSCSKSLQKLLSEIPTGSFSNPQAASQIAPSLEGKTYLDVGKLDCAADVNNLTLPEISTAPPPVTQAVLIRVEYNIEDGLQHTFSDAVNVTIARGSRLIRVLEEAQQMYPVRFRFNTTMSLWGPSLTSIRGLSASNKERTYWQLLNGSTPLDQGIGDYQPFDGESIFAVLSNY